MNRGNIYINKIADRLYKELRLCVFYKGSKAYKKELSKREERFRKHLDFITNG